MAGLDDLFAQIPVGDIAKQLGVNEGEVNAAIKTLVPALVGGVAENVQADNIDSSDLESAVAAHAASGLLDPIEGVSLAPEVASTTRQAAGGSASPINTACGLRYNGATASLDITW